MRLAKVRIKGFQSFEDSGDIEFGAGINLIIGQNNAGKSALLRSLEPNLRDDRHKSSEKWRNEELPVPEAYLEVELSGNEVRSEILRHGGQFYVPISDDSSSNGDDYLKRFFDANAITFSVVRAASSSLQAKNFPSHGLFNGDAESRKNSLLIQPINGEIKISNLNGGQNDSLANVVSSAWQLRMFHFSAERYGLGSAPHGRVERLSANADNLPQVLHTLSTERVPLFSTLNMHLREIFDSVFGLTIPTSQTNGGHFEIRIWPTDGVDRLELSFPLANSGTGVAQVVAILTAVMTVENAVIVIDEINSFLHPAAVKSLLRILQTDYTQHQYIISTHAPEVISFANPSTVHLVTRSGYDSKVTKLDLDDIEQLREVADHLGVSMSDVFAAERVIWVEGPTEELCFPHIYSVATGSSLPKGVVMTSVVATGDLGGKQRTRKIVYEVYERISKAAAPLVKSVLFSFDSELLSDKDKEMMQADTGGNLRFLPRRHFECYLVSPAAIRAFIVSKDSDFSGLTEEAVETELRRLAGEESFRKSWVGDLSAEQWLAKVDAAKLIAKACQTLSDQRVTFNKKKDSLFLLRYRLEHEREHVQPLIDYVVSLVEDVGNQQ